MSNRRSIEELIELVGSKIERCEGSYVSGCFFERKYDCCEHCGRYDKEELFFCGNDLFNDDNPMTRVIDKGDGRKVIAYGSGGLAVLDHYMPSHEHYSGEDALERLEGVKHVIRDGHYQRIREALQEEGAYMWWWA